MCTISNRVNVRWMSGRTKLPGELEGWKSKESENLKSPESESVLPKMSAEFWSLRKKTTPGLIWAIFDICSRGGRICMLMIIVEFCLVWCSCPGEPIINRTLPCIIDYTCVFQACPQLPANFRLHWFSSRFRFTSCSHLSNLWICVKIICSPYYESMNHESSLYDCILLDIGLTSNQSIWVHPQTCLPYLSLVWEMKSKSAWESVHASVYDYCKRVAACHAMPCLHYTCPVIPRHKQMCHTMSENWD